MHFVMGGLEPWAFALSLAVALVAGFVKGAVGFAMPMIMISALGSFLPGHLALAALILPTLASNSVQALRQGPRAAWASVLAFRRMILMIVIFIVVSAQFVLAIPQWLMFLLLGVPIVWFTGVQLSGRTLTIHIRHRVRAEYGLGIIAGLYGGISGVWGPPLLVYLLSVGVDKRTQVRVQGVVFLVGAIMLLAAHLRSGVLNAQTAPLSAALVIPALAGMGLGFRLQDRLDPAHFRRWTLLLLAMSGLNLIRRGLMG